MVLREFGLSDAAEQAYRLVAEHKTVTKAELGAHLRSRQLAEKAYHELCHAGLVVESWEHDDGVAVLDPEVALDRLLAARAADLARGQEQLAAARAATVAFTRDLAKRDDRAPNGDRQQPGSANRLTEHSGPDAIWRALDQAYGFATQEVLVMYPRSALTAKQVNRVIEMDTQALARGVSIRQIHAAASSDRRHAGRHRVEAAAAGAEVREAANVPLQMVVVDRQLAIVASAGDLLRSAVSVRNDAIIGCLELAFEVLWQSATPVVRAARRPAGVAAAKSDGEDQLLSEDDLTLLRLLAVGMKDDVAARRLGISVRTLRRQVASLMELLNTESRFQLGAHAASRGWLELPPRQLQARPGGERRKRAHLPVGTPRPASARAELVHLGHGVLGRPPTQPGCRADRECADRKPESPCQRCGVR